MLPFGRHTRLRSAAVLLCCCAAVATAPAIFVAVSGDASTTDISRATGTTTLDASRPATRRAIGQAVAQRKRLASPQAERQRKRSRTAFTDLPASRALSVGRKAHRSVLAEQVPKPLAGARRRGLAVDHFASPYAAVLRPRKGAGADAPGVMAMSTLPLRSRDENGQLRLVNLEPESAGDAFVPDNARVKLSIGDRASDGVKLVDRDIAIVPLDVKAVPGVTSADAVFFAGSAEASDHIVRVSPAGVDNLVQLRGQSSPERFRYRVDLPPGGTMDEVAGGEIAVRQDGRRVGTITKPKAWDADQRAIPVKTTLQGRVLTLDIAHRGRDIRYPAMLDPNYVDILQYRWYTPGNNNNSTRYWAHRTNRADLMNGVFADAGQGKSLITGTRGNQIVPAGTFAYWTFTAPGTTSVAQAEWTRMTHSEIHNGPAPCIDFGLTLASTAWHPSPTARGNQNGQPVCSTFTQVYRVTCWDCNDRDGVSHDPNVKGAQFGTSVYQTSIINQLDQVGEVTVYVVDPDDPTVTFTSQAPTGWMNTPTGTISATGNDPGLGVKTMQIANATPQSNSDCLDAGPCPFTQPISASVASLGLPDGNNAVPVTAKDASYFSFRDANGNPVSAQHEKTVTTPVKLDRTPPTITPTGTLYDARDGFVGPNQDYTLSVTATDGFPSPASAQRSGTTSLTATLDGQPMTNGSKSEPCTRPESSCPLTISPTLTGAQVAELGENVEHTVTITSSDALGQASTPVTFKFRVDRTEPEVYVAGTLFESDQATVSDASYTVDPLGADEAPDSAPEGAPTAGIRSIEFLVDGQRVDFVDFGCRADCQREAGRGSPYTLSTASHGDGEHEFDVLVTDAAGNVAISDASATFAGVTALPPDRLSLPAETTTRYNGGAPGDRAGQSVANVGDVDGDGLEDTLVGAPGHDPGNRSGAGAAWLVLGSEAAADKTLRVGEPGVSRFVGAAATDAAGTSVAAAGDVNGDGYSDMLIGAPGPVLTGVPVRGTVYVVYGGATPQDLDLGTLGSGGMTIRGPLVNLPLPDLLVQPSPKTFGSSLATRRLGDFGVDGDVNGDGLDDIVIGASDQDPLVSLLDVRPDGGIVYVVFGRAAGGTVDVTSLGDSGYRILGAAGLHRAGQAVALPGDINGDDRADVVVVSPNAKGSAERTDAGIAYVTYGKTDSADLDLKTLGAGGTRVLGATGDALRTAAGPGDVDSDSTPDLLLGGRDAATVFLQPDRDVDLAAAAFAGYSMLAPSPTAGSATVSAAGDLDGDDGADHLIGYPALGTVYAVRGKQNTAPVSLATLPGNDGTSLQGGSDTPVSIDTLDAGPGGAPTLRAGSPTASPSGANSGSVSASQSVTKTNRGPNACQPSALWKFPYTKGPPDAVLPRCRYARNRTVDTPAFSTTSPRARFNAKPTCGATSPSCRPGAIGGGNARLEAGIKTKSQLELVDSFERPMVKLVKRTVSGIRLCFDVYDARTPTVKAGSTCDVRPPTTPAQVGLPAQVVIVGKACMATDKLEGEHWLMRILGINKKVPGRKDPVRQPVLFEELQGFVKRDDITRLPSTRNGYSSQRRALDAYTGCGVPRKRKSPNSGTPLTIPPAAFGFEDRYVSNPSFRDSESANPPGLGAGEYGGYSNYQVPVLKAPDLKQPPRQGESFINGADWAALTTSSTAVSGSGYKKPQLPPGQQTKRRTGPGGVVRAIVPRGQQFLEMDRMAYSDPNVRCALNGAPPLDRVATWVYGAANPNGDRNHKMIGWLAIRRPAAGVRVFPPGPYPPPPAAFPACGP